MSARSFTLDTRKQGNILVHKIGQTILVNLHGHTVVAQDERGTVSLSSCGYRTNVTKTAINRFLELSGYSERVAQKKGVWYIGDQIFFDGYKLTKTKLEKVLA